MAKVIETHFRLTSEGALSTLKEHRTLEPVCVLKIRGQHDLQAAQEQNIQLTELVVLEPKNTTKIWGIIGEKAHLQVICRRINDRASQITKTESFRRGNGTTRGSRDPRYAYC